MEQEIDFQPIDFQPEGASQGPSLRGLYTNAVHDVSGVLGSLDPRNWPDMLREKQAADQDLAHQAKHPDTAFGLPGDRLAKQIEQIPGVLYQHPVQSAMLAAPMVRPAIDAAPGVMQTVKTVATHPMAKSAAKVGINVATGGLAGAVGKVGGFMDAITTLAKNQAPVASHTPVAPAAVAADALSAEILKRIATEPDWRTVDAVPIDAMKTKGIIEPGESRVGLSERMAQAMKTDPKAAEELARALRQRMHISAKAGK